MYVVCVTFLIGVIKKYLKKLIALPPDQHCLFYILFIFIEIIQTIINTLKHHFRAISIQIVANRTFAKKTKKKTYRFAACCTVTKTKGPE